MPGIASLRKFFGRTVSEGAAFAAGTAVSPALLPVVQALVNEAWSLHPDRPPEVGALATGVAQGQVDPKQARTWAAQHGIGGKAFDALVEIANTGPGVPVAFDLWRRKVIDEAGFRRAAKRQGIEPEWIDDLVKIKHEVLDPADLARGIHRGLVPDPGLLKGELPSGEGNVPAYPVYPIDALAEAEAAGFDKDHLGVLVGLQGNPMGAHEAAQAEFRGILTRDDFLRAIAEGNTRNEWAQAIYEQSRQIPSVTNYVEAFVRGWITKEQMQAGAARHGMTADDAEIEFLIHGRPLSWHQVFIGLRRGGVYDGPTDQIDPAFLKALRESNIRPEWYNLAWAQRFTYPAAFVLRALATDGDLTADETETILLYEGWEPGLAHKVAAKWAGGGGGTASTPATTANKAAIRAVGKSYTQGRHTRADAEAELTTLGVDQAEWPALFQAWDVTREATVKGLSPAQIKRAFKAGRYTEAEALAALEAAGYTAADATTYLTS